MARQATLLASRPLWRVPQRPALLLGCALLVLLAGCDALTGLPQQGGTVGRVPQDNASVPSGAHLYCLTNVGHTLLAFSAAQNQALAETARYVDLDPSGPWFDGGMGYYISRVESAGRGANALIAFDPVTLAEQGRLVFPPNSNPNSLLLLPSHPGVAWVALRGSTFDLFATNGIAVVDLATMAQLAYVDLASLAAAAPAPGLGETLTSLLGFTWDAAGCGGAGCAYAVVNNFDGQVRAGWLLVLTPDADPAVPPALNAAVRLGPNPVLEMVLEPSGELWVVNNGGYMHFDPSGVPGALQVLDSANFAVDGDGDGLPGVTVPVETACAPLPNPDTGCDPTGIHALDASTAWVTTYPDDVVRAVDLTTNLLLPYDPALPRVTGPLFSTAFGLFAAQGGYGAATLGELDAATGGLTATHALNAGNGPLSCAPYTNP